MLNPLLTNPEGMVLTIKQEKRPSLVLDRWYQTFSSQCSILIPREISENLWFSMFSGESKGNIGKKRVKERQVVSVENQ